MSVSHVPQTITSSINCYVCLILSNWTNLINLTKSGWIKEKINNFKIHSGSSSWKRIMSSLFATKKKHSTAKFNHGVNCHEEKKISGSVKLHIDANFPFPLTLGKAETQTWGSVGYWTFCSTMISVKWGAIFPFCHNGWHHSVILLQDNIPQNGSQFSIFHTNKCQFSFSIEIGKVET